MGGVPFVAAAAFAAAIATACATAPVGRADLLDFLVDGRTTRREVYLKLGPPSQVYEAERIVSFRLRKDEGGYVLLGTQPWWRDVNYALMIAFDAKDIVRQHTLVTIHAP
jgi:hypothetical protein